MKLPAIFQGKECNCGTKIQEESIKEIGIDLSTGKFIFRFDCPECGLNGKFIFKNENKKLEDLCGEIIKMVQENEPKTETNKKITKEEVFSKHFDQNAIGCLFIPDWTEEYISNFKN